MYFGVRFSALFIVAASAAALAAQTGSAPSSAARQSPSAPAAALSSSERELVTKYCISCHSERLKTGGLSLQGLDPSAAGSNAEVWEKVLRKLRAGVMPPAGLPRPDDAGMRQFVSTLATAIDRDAALHPNPGRTETLHRLNRTEYRNAVRDLLGVNVDVSELLPIDDTGVSGFDNTASVLKISDSLLRQYLSAARKISRLAIGPGSATLRPTTEEYEAYGEAPQYQRLEGMPIGTRGGLALQHAFVADAEYDFEIELGGARNFYLSEYMVVLIDDKRVHRFHLPGSKELSERGPAVVAAERLVASMDPGAVEGIKDSLASGDNAETLAKLYAVTTAEVEAVGLTAKSLAPAGRTVSVRLPVAAGMRSVGVTFAQTVRTVSESTREPFEVADGGGGLVPISQPFVSTVRITGPYNATGAAQLPSRSKIFVCTPKTAAQEPVCARTILSTLARRAYRGPVSEDDIKELLRFYTTRRTAEGGTFDEGITLAVQRILSDPKFLYRIELPVSAGASAPRPAAAAARSYQISDLSLASRLSFFLWSSIPDDELLKVAEQGRLRQPAVLTQQIKRMLADPRAEALTTNFAEQWLRLREVKDIVPHGPTFPDFDDTLRLALIEETRLFFASIVSEDRSVLDLIDADYTFVNERLARHYGIPFVQGSRFRRVQLEPNSPRRGLLGKGSILLVTSNPLRTSPVRRGKWILENILSSPPPRPPANVPPFPEKKAGSLQVLSVRERQAEHRKNPACAQCHSMIDPPGFAMEQFDGTGAWRVLDENRKPIDATGGLPDGSTFDGVIGLRTALMKKPELFATTLTEKLLQYALGRELAYYDMPAVRKIVREAAASKYSFSALIAGVAKSQPFMFRETEATVQQVASAQ